MSLAITFTLPESALPVHVVRGDPLEVTAGPTVQAAATVAGPVRVSATAGQTAIVQATARQVTTVEV